MKKYIRSSEDYTDVINPDDKEYYDKVFEVDIWSGAGNNVYDFVVYANYAETALEKVVAYCEEKGYTGLIYEVDEVPEDEEDMFIYVDGTMEGASRPYYILQGNFWIKEI